MTLDDIQGTTEWSAAEQHFIQSQGRVALVTHRPERRTAHNTIRPSLIEYFAHRSPEGSSSGNGLHLVGCWITGDLSLNVTDSALKITIEHCVIEGALRASDAEVSQINLTGTSCHSLTARRLITKSNLYLVDGFTCAQNIDLQGAKIGGQLVVEQATLEKDLFCQSVQVADGFIFRNLTQAPRHFNAIQMQVTVLADDMDAWMHIQRYDITGFEFEHIISTIPLAMRRKIWARKSEDPQSFDPYPYSFLAKYFDKTGHREDAAQLRAERDWRLDQADYTQAWHALDGTWRAARDELWAKLQLWIGWVYRLTSGHGHLPLRSLVWLFLLMGVGTFVFGTAYNNHQLVPAPPPILASQDWQRAIAQQPDNPVIYWNSHSQIAKDYETFNAPLFAADVVIPLINFSQEDAWSPTTNRGPWGVVAFYTRPTLKILGWILTAIGAAAVTGVIGRKD